MVLASVRSAVTRESLHSCHVDDGTKNDSTADLCRSLKQIILRTGYNPAIELAHVEVIWAMQNFVYWLA